LKSNKKEKKPWRTAEKQIVLHFDAAVVVLNNAGKTSFLKNNSPRSI
jgi:hypothetical protein